MLDLKNGCHTTVYTVKVLLEKWVGWVGYECAAKEWLRYRSNQFNSWAVIFLYIQRRKFFFYCSIKCHLGIFGLFGCFLKFSWICPFSTEFDIVWEESYFGSNPLRRTFRKDQYPLNFMTSSTTADSEMSNLLKSRAKMFMNWTVGIKDIQNQARQYWWDGNLDF